MDKKFVTQLIPESGMNDLLDTYLNWSGVGFVCALLAGMLDGFSGVIYAAHYTTSVNNAIGFNFWMLVSSIGALLFCLALPLIYLSTGNPGLVPWVTRLRRFAYMFFLVAYDEGALMIGILTANMLHTSDRAELILNKTLLFSDHKFLVLIALLLINSLLWFIGEAIYNRKSANYSGLVAVALQAPLKFSVPVYSAITLLLGILVIVQ